MTSDDVMMCRDKCHLSCVTSDCVCNNECDLSWVMPDH